MLFLTDDFLESFTIFRTLCKVLFMFILGPVLIIIPLGEFKRCSWKLLSWNRLDQNTNYRHWFHCFLFWMFCMEIFSSSRNRIKLSRIEKLQLFANSRKIENSDTSITTYSFDPVKIKIFMLINMLLLTDNCWFQSDALILTLFLEI